MLNDPSPWARRAWAKLRSSAAVATALVLLGSAFAGSAQAVELPAGVKLPDGAVATPGAISDGTKVRLLAGVGGVGTLAGISAGLEFQLAPGWKTYWRSPGDAGYPVTVDWGGSRNLAAAEFAWPAPHRFTLFGLDTFGYSDEVVFPITSSWPVR